MFENRWDAGRVLARMVASRTGDPHPVVLALPRGGVPIGVEVARALGPGVELDVFLVRKLGVPGREELAFGAIATGGVRALNSAVVEDCGLSDEEIERIAQREQLELESRESLYRRERPPVALRDRMAIVVDDGLATGASMMAAVRAIRLHQPKRIVAAAPVASRQAVTDLRAVADDVVCPEVCEPFHAVGYWYREFDQVTDAEVHALLERFIPPDRARASKRHSAPRTDDSAESE